MLPLDLDCYGKNASKSNRPRLHPTIC